jgi:predicted phosphodiesterase
MRILIAGDTHGNIRSVKQKIDKAVEHGIQRIVVLGDFGLWSGFDGIQFLDEVNEYASQYNRQVFAIKGNHEIHWDETVALAKKNKATSHGWAYVRSNVLLSPRVHQFRWGAKQFVVLGGAVSIDKKERLEYQRQKDKQIYDPNEQTSDSDVESIRLMSNHFKTDYLLTHDCSDRTPWRSRLKPDIDSQINRGRIDKAINYLKPGMQFHGHMHTKYDWTNLVGADGKGGIYTHTYGLQCDNNRDSWGILDIGTGEFQFESDLVS